MTDERSIERQNGSFCETNDKKAKEIIEKALSRYEEYKRERSADETMCFEEWFDWHLGDDELEGDGETLEYLKTLPPYNSPESNGWIWRIMEVKHPLEE